MRAQIYVTGFTYEKIQLIDSGEVLKGLLKVDKTHYNQLLFLCIGNPNHTRLFNKKNTTSHFKLNTDFHTWF